MKILHSNSQGLGASALLATVVITAIAGLLLAAYLTLVKSQNYSTFRSQAWNNTIPVVEAGIEDALTHLNVHGTTNLACDGWAGVNSTLYKIERTVGENRYLVTISNFVAGVTNLTPVIESRGYVTAPVLVSAQNYLFAQAGGNTPGRYLSRGVRVTTRRNALFSKGLVAKGQIDLNGNNIRTDSFDSSDTNYSNNGQYDASRNKDNGDVATNSGLTNSVNVGNADILGRVSTGPGGSVSIGANGSVGDKAWYNSGQTGVKPGWVKNDMNVEFPDVQPPFTGGAFGPPSGGTVNGTDYEHVFGSANYQMSDLTLSGQKEAIVTGHAVIYVTGDVSMSGQSKITIAPGASLKLYVGGLTTSLGGQGIVNDAGYADRFMYYGLTNNTSVSFSGNSAMIGVIYAPSAALTLSGGGSTDTDFIGASISKTVKMNGHFKFHYDEALGKFGPAKGYVVTSWNEMTPNDVATLPTGVYFEGN